MADKKRVISRQDLYDEIWLISTKKVAEKYGVVYSKLLKICKENDIPIPPSGYWTALSFGKPVEQTSLPISETTEIDLFMAPIPPSKTSPNTNKSKKTVEKNISNNADSTKPKIELPSLESLGKADIITEYGKEYNLYHRDILYEEVWKLPLSTLCGKYAISDVGLKKVCKTLEIPLPPQGHWAKLYAGKKVLKTPLPKTTVADTKKGARNENYVDATKKESPSSLAFLGEDDRNTVFQDSKAIILPNIMAKANPQIIAYKAVIKNWKDNDKRDEYAQRSLSRVSYWKRNEIPFLAEYVSSKSLPRVYQILGALIKAVEKAGGTINNSLEFYVRGENIPLEITESQSKVEHVLTRQEAKELREYNMAKLHGKYAYKPNNTRKYDYIFNGNLTFYVGGDMFRDSANKRIEDMLEQIYIAMHEESEQQRIYREEREQKAARREAEERERQRKRDLYNAEVEKLEVLINLIEDYETARKIRNYACALKEKHILTEEENSFILWAEDKANWYDPTVAKPDHIFGERNHEKSSRSKEISKRYY